MSTIAVNAITDASGGNTASINGATPTNDNLMGRNRIINGDMRIDQRNAGASTNNAGGSTTYALDRWAYYATSGSKFTIQQSSTAPDGFSNSMIITSSAATTIGAGDEYWLIQPIEGFNTADLNWGTSSAKTVTVSFWVRSSLTGTFGGSIINGAYNYSYPFSFSISAANTWEQKSVTITAPTAGTWVGATNGTGLRLVFSLAAGSTYGNGTVNTWQSGTYKIAPTGATNILETNGATFYLTGIQLEAGSVATSFERVDYGEMLRRCQRYALMIRTDASMDRFGVGSTVSSTTVQIIVPHPASFRAAASSLLTTGTASDYQVYSTGVTTCSQVPSLGASSTYNSRINFITSGGLTGGQASQAVGNTSAFLLLSAEL